MSENDDPESFTLREALVQIVGPETLQAYQQWSLRRARALFRPRRSNYHLTEKPLDPWSPVPLQEPTERRLERQRGVVSGDWGPASTLKKQVEEAVAEVKRKLISGEWIARGFEGRVPLTGQRTLIPSDRWHILNPQFGDSSAKGGGLHLVDIRVRENPERAQAGSGAGPEASAEAPPSGRRRPGPRSFIPEAEEEMRAMAKAGELTGSLKRDSHVIADRVAARFPSEKVCTAKTIHNRLNKLYRELGQ